MFDRGAQKKRIFTHVSSQVQSAAVLSEAAANDDVLAKLLHGYFGFHQTDRAKMKAHLEGTGGFTPSPDVSRILGALTFENTIADNPPAQDVVDDLKDIRAALETALHVELRNLAKQPVDIPDSVDILRTVDAGSGWFGHDSTVTIRVYKEDPRKRGVQSIGYLLPDEFFPFGRKGKKKTP